MKDITPDRGGAGSTYGGTQSGDNNAPDGYQKPKRDEGAQDESTEPEGGLGHEYDSKSSYGKKGEQDDSVKPSGNQEEGSPIP